MQIRISAKAKINLGLDVLNRRPDGYHNIRTVMQTVTLCDDLIFSESSEKGIRLFSDSQAVPLNESNLIWKAAQLMINEFSLTKGIFIRLEKNIPVAAGLAGGSTDAAATLSAVNRLFSLELDDRALAGLGARLGADVPFCIYGGTMLAEGIGELLTPLPPLQGCPVIIGKPKVSVSTRMAYESLDLSSLEHPDMAAILSSIQKEDPTLLPLHPGNVFAPGVIKMFPVIENIIGKMEELGSFCSQMSGSGPSVFGLFPDRRSAEQACSNLSVTFPDSEFHLAFLG
ncbi:MAG: 4-(cytidine 5'-diphospho)-2-C-methyl-D-erythritol kinase [Blautia sp.]|nr:4-(cytidine 5'-diphospho)-2-C-methyl-D-erythritol kinase [Blautia sp.]